MPRLTPAPPPPPRAPCQVVLWVLPHVLAPLALFYLHAGFRHILLAALRPTPGVMSMERVQLLGYAALQAAAGVLYAQLYGSDPGAAVAGEGRGEGLHAQPRWGCTQPSAADACSASWIYARLSTCSTNMKYKLS